MNTPRLKRLVGSISNVSVCVQRESCWAEAEATVGIFDAVSTSALVSIPPLVERKSGRN